MSCIAAYYKCREIIEMFPDVIVSRTAWEGAMESRATQEMASLSPDGDFHRRKKNLEN